MFVKPKVRKSCCNLKLFRSEGVGGICPQGTIWYSGLSSNLTILLQPNFPLSRHFSVLLLNLTTFWSILVLFEDFGNNKKIQDSGSKMAAI